MSPARWSPCAFEVGALRLESNVCSLKVTDVTDGVAKAVETIRLTCSMCRPKKALAGGCLSATLPLKCRSVDAAMALMGRSANGWVEWKDAQGRTLDEVKRQAVSKDD